MQWVVQNKGRYSGLCGVARRSSEERTDVVFPGDKRVTVRTCSLRKAAEEEIAGALGLTLAEIEEHPEFTIPERAVRLFELQVRSEIEKESYSRLGASALDYVRNAAFAMGWKATLAEKVCVARYLDKPTGSKR